MTAAELASLRDNIDAVKDAIQKFAAGDRVSEVRFADRLVKYAEVTLPQLRDELSRLEAQLPKQSGRIRPMIYRGL